jgi:hypothetical protein
MIEMDLNREDLACLGWQSADDFSRIFPDDAPDLEALAPPEAVSCRMGDSSP